ncbi:Hypothetical protein CINCED_3A014240 [Cinara cedri]|uniref:Uncharacterized protein n=1 Tax=Cinara cedri TaxID=506608 RepID=A0A5E4MTA0_9HEMI|nr:Hypothetical protein CINCED_3A014240 [Cinara cedri]
MTYDNPNLIYSHCMAHVLNLVIEDSTESCLLAENLYGLLEETARYLYCNIFYQITGEQHKTHAKLYRIRKICETREWSKHKALASIIDPEEDVLESCKFCNFHLFLVEVIGGSFDSKTKFTAHTLLETWSQFQTSFAAMIILNLFSITSPVSKFLQSYALDYLRA